MVITTHMFNQMSLGNQTGTKMDKIPKNQDSMLIKTFLNDATNFKKTEKTVISSSS